MTQMVLRKGRKWEKQEGGRAEDGARWRRRQGEATTVAREGRRRIRDPVQCVAVEFELFSSSSGLSTESLWTLHVRAFRSRISSAAGAAAVYSSYYVLSGKEQTSGRNSQERVEQNVA